MIAAKRTIIAVVLGATAVAACGAGEADEGDTAGPTATPSTVDGASADGAAATDPAPVSTTPELAPEPEPGPTSEPDIETTVPAESRVIEHRYGTTEVPVAPERIVALSEEFLLADLLALGVTPIASTSNDASTFGGVDPASTAGVEILASADFNVEQLAALRPDLIVAYPSYLEIVGYDTIAAVAPTVAVGELDSDWRERLRAAAAVFGLESAGDELIDAIEADFERARSVLDGVTVSALSVSPGPFIRAYTDDRTTLTEVMVEIGVELVPGAGAGAEGVDDNGRIVLSLEQLEVLQGDVIALLQTSVIADEDAAVDAVVDSPLWPTLPAVDAGRLVTLDRLAYPGAVGNSAFASDLAAAVEAVL